MSSEKQIIEEDSDTVQSNITKTDEQDDETKSKTNESDIDNTNDDDDTSSNASSEYEVEKILAKRKRRRGGGFEYYIKWVGYDDSANEWIPETSLSCPERVAEFERQELKKRQETKKEQFQPSKRRSTTLHNNQKQKHKQKHQRKRRRMKVIDNDDDDDNNTESIQTTKPPSSPSEPVSSVESSTQSDKDSNAHISITYGVEQGYEVLAILGINRTHGDQLHYLVHYKAPTTFEDNMELIPSNIAKKYCEDEIIQFFETRIAWNERENN